jgi:superfamily II DNA helicase RecQ
VWQTLADRLGIEPHTDLPAIRQLDRETANLLANAIGNKLAPALKRHVADAAATVHRHALPPPRPSDKLPEDKALAALRNVTGKPTAGWSNDKQLEAVECLFNNRRDAAFVLPTGAGKTAIWQVAVTAFDPPTAVTIVVLPFIALEQQQYLRTRTAQIQCEVWAASGSTFPRSSVIFITPETLCRKDVHNRISSIHGEGNLRRFVLDEAHVYVLDQHYRADLRRIEYIREFAVPIIMMSGSLPPSIVPQLLQAVSISPVSDMHHLRMSTRRSNIRYVVHNVPSEEEAQDLTVVLVNEWLATRPNSRSIVFVQAVEASKVFADVLGCEEYYAQLDIGQKTNRLDKFERGEHRVIVSTAALSTGIHVPNLDRCVHPQGTRSWPQLMQEWGRLGREGQYAEGHLVVNQMQLWAPQQPDVAGTKDMNQVLKTKTICLRYAAESFIDGKDLALKCSEQPKSVPCSICKPYYSEHVWLRDCQRPPSSNMPSATAATPSFTTPSFTAATSPSTDFPSTAAAPTTSSVAAPASSSAVAVAADAVSSDRSGTLEPSIASTPPDKSESKTTASSARKGKPKGEQLT